MPDVGNAGLYVYGKYDGAYDKFKELIRNERDPEMSRVGNIEFEDGYPKDDHSEFEFEDNNSCEGEVYWRITDKDDRYQHSFMDLRVMEASYLQPDNLHLSTSRLCLPLLSSKLLFAFFLYLQNFLAFRQRGSVALFGQRLVNIAIKL